MQESDIDNNLTTLACRVANVAIPGHAESTAHAVGRKPQVTADGMSPDASNLGFPDPPVNGHDLDMAMFLGG